MLKREVAESQLKEMKAANWIAQRLTKVGKLPGKSRAAAGCVLGRDSAGKELEWDALQKARREQRRQLRQMSAKDRAQMFQVLFGNLAPYVQRGWDMLRTAPYGKGYYRKAFRAPNLAEVIADGQMNWLASLCRSLEGFAGQHDITWVAAWAPHLLAYGQDDLGLLLAAAIDAGGATAESVLEILKDSARGEHEIGCMGRHVTRALFTCSDPQAWEFVEKLLLAAQRQEGLRQAILETIDEAHPQAFRRMLRLILDNNLARFAATVRAIDVWFGFQWDAISVKKVNEVLEKVLLYLDSAPARQKALAGKDAEQAFLALWCVAYEDAEAAIPLAAKLLKDKNEGKRFVAVHLLFMLNLEAAREAAIAALDDADMRVVARAIDCFARGTVSEELAAKTDLFDHLEELLARAPEQKTLYKPIVWPWWTILLSKEEVANALEGALGNRPVTRLIPYLESMHGYRRASVVRELVKAKKFDAATREVLLTRVADNYCRESAIEGLGRCKLTDAEARQMEKLLTRKSGDLRRGVLGLLAGQKDATAMASAERLLECRDGLQRRAGLELLRLLVEAKRAIDQARQRARDYQEHAKLSKDERVHLDAILNEGRETETLDDALGLLDVSRKTVPAEPKKRAVTYCSPAARQIIQELDNLIHAHREEKVFIPDWRWDNADEDSAAEDDEAAAESRAVEKPKGTEELLGNVNWSFPSPKPNLPLEKDLQRLPLRQLWSQWWEQRPASMRDQDGLEIIRAMWLAEFPQADDETPNAFEKDPAWLIKLRLGMLSGIKPVKANYAGVVNVLLRWLLRLDTPKAAADFLLDGFESALAAVPKDKLAEEIKDWGDDPFVISRWRNDGPLGKWEGLLRQHVGFCPGDWRAEHWGRWFKLCRWWDEPTGNATKLQIPRNRPEWEDVLRTFQMGQATEADLIDHLLGPRSNDRWGGDYFQTLSQLTKPKPPKVLAEIPELARIVQRCRERILEVELKRGDSPTAATAAAARLSCSGGLNTLARVLEALGQDKLQRSTHWGNAGKPAIFSHLIRTSMPEQGDTPEAFASCMRVIGVGEDRLIEVAVYAPQWARHVEQAMSWPGLEDAIWWLHAHTRDTHWSLEEEIRQKWEASVRQRTPLAGRDLLEGAVDVAWFHRAYDALGARRWDRLYEAAKYASSAGGHKRAQLFADAMLNREKKAELLRRIGEKRNQDAVRALGLLPLAGAGDEGASVLSDAARKDLHERYKVLAEFIRTSRQFGSMRQASEKRAAGIGMENLARTAGFADPVRLQWAMEGEETRDLAQGPVTAKAGDIAVTLSINEDGQPQVVARNTKTERELSAVPAAARKDEKVAELLARKTELRRTASRVRQSLEAAMCRGDAFSGMELRDLLANPMLVPLLLRTVFVGEGILGYPVDGGQGLEDCAGKIEPVKKNERLRIAHPVDLLASGRWDRWQRDCFARERVQPFKQIFRELYVPTQTERSDGEISRRYAGHQVNPRQAMALLTSRGWVAAPEEGVFRTFHDLGLTAWLTFQESFYTPAEIEGLTLEGVRFAKRDQFKPMAVDDVPPRLFSEVMRDVDLVVSVAHRGGVDPEASASTVQMRAALVRETCALLKLENVRVMDSHALVEGSLARYTVHLGSAVTHRQPGGALFIVAVHSQHRGRLFLPFADDDPRTAEVISKVLLLARDKEIQDPSLLAQIRA